MNPQFLPLPGTPATLVNLLAIQYVQFADDGSTAVIHLGANAVTVSGDENVTTLRAQFAPIPDADVATETKRKR